LGHVTMMIDHSEHPLEHAIAAAWPMAEWRDMHVLLAVSGGPDSVALLRAVIAIKRRVNGRGKVFVGHFNHRMRGEQADADQVWLAEVCRRLELPFEAGGADVAALAAEQGDGWEAAARTARYEFLSQTAERVGARWVATGHTRDDQVETVVHRLMRGTGLAGLAGMRVARPLLPTVTLVRPMLGLSRGDVLAYLSALRQDFRTDATNANVRFARNRLRHQLLPVLRAESGVDFDVAILRLAEQAAESQAVIDQHAAELVAKCVEFERPDGLRIDCQMLAGQPILMVREVCRRAWQAMNWPQQAMGFVDWKLLASLAMEGEGRPQINLPGDVLAVREGDLLLVRRGVANTRAKLGAAR
jgi:tRNA(Ile)-lysidine synthase